MTATRPDPAEHLGGLRPPLGAAAVGVSGLVTLLALAVATALAAQQASSVAGVVLDAQTGKPVPDVLVSVQDTDLRALSDSAGRFRVAGVPAGNRGLVFRHLAYGEHTRTVLVEETASLELQVRISQEAIELAPLVVEALTELARQQRASGSATRELGLEEIQAAARKGLRLIDLLQQMPGVQLRLGTPDCIEYRPARADGGCRDLAVLVDGVLIGEPGLFLTDVDVNEIERLEILSAGEAGALYGGISGNGVLLVETRSGPAPTGTASSGTASPFDWSLEARPYPWSRVLATSFVANALAVGLTYLPFAYCSRAWEGSFERRPRCHPAVAVGTGFAAVAIPGPVVGLSARKAGSTERSRGHLGWMPIGALTHLTGHLLFFNGRATGSHALQAAGIGILTLGTPVVVTLADRFFRKER